jgi:hypothetical protein
MVLERKILPAPGGFGCAENASGIHIRLIRWTFPILGMDKGVEPPALHVISYPKREARAPTDYATSKISVGMVPSILVAVGQGQDHSPDTKRTAEPLHH